MKAIKKIETKINQLTPDLIKHGNQSLLSDVEVAVEMFRAAYNGSLALSNDGG